MCLEWVSGHGELHDFKKLQSCLPIDGVGYGSFDGFHETVEIIFVHVVYERRVIKLQQPML
jgi:hypothetical protein